MITKSKTLWICFAQYFALLFFHTLYAFMRMGSEVGVRVLIASAFGMLVALISVHLKWETLAS